MAGRKEDPKGGMQKSVFNIFNQLYGEKEGLNWKASDTSEKMSVREPATVS